jgi:hypothetical protein
VKRAFAFLELAWWLKAVMARHAALWSHGVVFWIKKGERREEIFRGDAAGREPGA